MAMLDEYLRRDRRAREFWHTQMEKWEKDRLATQYEAELQEAKMRRLISISILANTPQDYQI